MWHEAQPISLNVSAPPWRLARQSSGMSAFTVGGGRVAWNATRRKHRRGDGIGHAAFGEVVAAGPADAVPLDRLHAMMNVERVDGELAQRGEHALAAEGSDDQIGIDAVDPVEIDDAVGMGDDQPTARLWSRGRRARLSPLARLPQSPRRGHLQVGVISRARSSTARRPSARSSAARSRTKDRWSRTARRSLRNEHVGDVVGRAADDRIVVATETGIRSGRLVRLNGGLTPSCAWSG